MKKRWLALLLAALTLGACTACDGGEETVKHGEKAPTYTSDKNFYIGMWVGVPNSIKTYDEDGKVVDEGTQMSTEDFENHYKLISEAGFNYVDAGYAENSLAYNQRALAAAEKYNLNQYISDPEINALLLDDVKDDEVVEEQLNTLAARYTGYKSFAGLRIKDEPSIDAIAGYSYAKKRFDKVFGDKTFYMNLFPVIAGPTQVSADYKEYIKEYVKQIGTDYVSYDHYPLKVDARENNYVLDNFLYNMELVKEAAPDKDVWTFLQSIQYGNTNRTLTSVADATFQAYSFLAYGGAGIQWFCYWSPPGFDGATVFGEGCIGRNGKPTAIYDYVKAANLEIRGLEDVYMNFDWQGVMPKIGTENDEGGENANFGYLTYKVMNKHDRIKSYKTQQDTLTGVFKDKDGRDGFMIVNFTEPSAGLKNKVELEFNDCTHALVVKKGKTEEVNAKNGKLTFTMDAGEGYFVIPLK